MTYQLVMKTGPAPGKVYSLEASEISIGREVGSNVFINDVEISRRHARLTLHTGNYILEDLGSTNGTFVNGHRATGSLILQPGDTITLGENVSLTFEAIPFDPNATQVSATSTVGETQPPKFETPAPHEDQVPPPTPPTQVDYASQIPPSSYETLIPEESPPNRTWLWASFGCAVVLICALVGGALIFDTLDLYCAPPFQDLTVLIGGVCP
jgi:predicted component of type VI protein secretion system